MRKTLKIIDDRPARPFKSSEVKELLKNYKKFPTIQEENSEESEKKESSQENEAKK